MKQFLLLFLLPLIFTSCAGDKMKSAFDKNAVIPKEQKSSTHDPFKKNMVPSQYFDVSGERDTVLEGLMGTVLVIPKGAFTNKKGEAVTGNIQVELAEALTMDQMLLSNLTTYSNGMPLESGGMIFLNATSNGEKLDINKDKPVYIEIPTGNKRPGMMAYEGQRDENGNMNWINPQALETWLVPVDLQSLDFLPSGFASAVRRGMPFRSHQEADGRLIDSLYYSLSVDDAALKREADSIVEMLTRSLNLNEPYANNNAKVVNRKYTPKSYNISPSSVKPVMTYSKGDLMSISDTSKKITYESEGKICGIDPARIKVIRSNAYENTLISTREFETRMKVIHQTCLNEILELYVNNLDKNLWEIDAMAAEKIDPTDSLHSRFLQFAGLKETKIQHSNVQADKLKRFYAQRLEQVKAELTKFKREQDKAVDRENKEVEQVADKYKKLLWKREKYRMEKYGFNWTKTGWVNIDNGVDPKPWVEKGIEIIVDKGASYDAVYTYFIYTSLQSIYRLNSADKEHFYTGDAEVKSIPIPKEANGVVVTVAYKDGNIFMGVKEFNTREDQITVFPSPSSQAGIRSALTPYDDYRTENKIEKDLEYQAYFYKERIRLEKQQKEARFLKRLWYKANPCCPEPNGEKLFRANCSACHKANDQKLTGPGLKGVLSRIPEGDWKYDWVHNSAAVIKSGDMYAKKICNENGGSMQTAFPGLTNEEIDAILEFADGGGDNTKK
jgi:hypothetical protein